MVCRGRGPCLGRERERVLLVLAGSLLVFYAFEESLVSREKERGNPLELAGGLYCLRDVCL